LLTDGPTRHIKFAKSSVDIHKKKIPETQLHFSTQPKITIPQIHQQFINVRVFCLLSVGLIQKRVLFSLTDTHDVRNIQPVAAMRVLMCCIFL
jgi:hypothetical protein